MSSYVQALQDVRARVKLSNTSFSMGMAVLPREKREAMYALYAFCREVDDIADEGATAEYRQRGLQEWRERIKILFERKGLSSFAAEKSSVNSNSITQVLAIALERFPLVEADFQDIIDGMMMDAGIPICAPDMATLDVYCDRVASAVGRASVRIFGDDSENGLAVAYHLGRALQLTNILRDLAEDAERGRLYLPRELLVKYGITTRDPKEVLGHAALPFVCRDLAERAQSHFAEADNAMDKCCRAIMRPARIMRTYYGAILERLLIENWRVPFRRVHLPKWRKLWLTVKSFF